MVIHPAHAIAIRRRLVHTALLDLVGSYDAASFSASADSGTGTMIEYVVTGLTPPPY